MDEVMGVFPSLRVSRRMDIKDEDWKDLGDGISLLPEDIMRKYIMNEGENIKEEKKNRGSEIPDMSMSMITDKSRREYLGLVQGKIAREAWNGKNPKVEKYMGDIKQKDAEWHTISYRLDKLHNKTFPYQGKIKDRAEFENVKGEIVIEHRNEQAKKTVLKNFSKNQLYGFRAYMSVEHKPTMMNYWHVTLCVRAHSNSEPIKSSRSENNRNICEQAFLKILRQGYEIDYEHADRLDRKLYTVSSISWRKTNRYWNRISRDLLEHPLGENKIILND